MTTIYAARWVLPSSTAPVLNGAIVVERERIVAVGDRSNLSEKFPDARFHDLGEAALLPGLVNVHSHLELTVMRGFLETKEADFFAWLQKLTTARLERMTPEDLYVSAAWGACEAARAGVTCLGDASEAAAESMRALSDVGLRGTVYQESFGPDPRLASENVEKLKAKVAALRELETPLVRVGVSPHSPYTVCATQLKVISEFALAESLPVMMHAAESAAEDLLVREGSGPFAEELAKRGIEWQTPGVSTIRYLERTGILRTKPLLAHCIRVDDADIETIKEADAKVAHCPKSNAKLGHGRAKYATFLKCGLDVGLGSDSVASNNTCDLLEESRFALLLARSAMEPADARDLLTAAQTLRTATLGGARSLGLASKIGEVREGLQADFIAVALNGAHQLPGYDPVSTLILASSGRDVLLTVVAGREVYSDGRVTTIDEDGLRARMIEIATKLQT